MTVALSIIAMVAWWKGGILHYWVLALAATLLLITLAKPDWLAAPNRAWMRLADLLHRVVSPIVLAVMFYGMFTPVAFVMRLAKRDALKRRYDAQATTYWVRRDPPGPDPSGIRNQF